MKRKFSIWTLICAICFSYLAGHYVGAYQANLLNYESQMEMFKEVAKLKLELEGLMQE